MYYALCVILYLLQVVNPHTKFVEHFKGLLSEYPIVNVGLMGFPEGWQNLKLWQQWQ